MQPLLNNAFQPAPRTLYIVATPIGNSRDITLRALDVLSRVNLIAAEDTRVTADLLRAHALPHVPLISVREHNEREGAQRVIAALARGESVAYVSDAGTPGVSDPGARLVASAREAGYAVVPIPGASAITALLSVAGIVESQFVFIGFLPTTARARDAILHDLRNEARAVILYESTHRIADLSAALAAALPDRDVIIGKELTKTFETIAKLPAQALPQWFADDAQRLRGEFVLLIAPVAQTKEGNIAEASKWLAALSAELPPAKAAKIVAQMTGVSRDALYDLIKK